MRDITTEEAQRAFARIARLQRECELAIIGCKASIKVTDVSGLADALEKLVALALRRE